MARILVIDDDPEVVDLLRMALTNAGHELKSAPDGFKGISLFRQQPFDLVICDIFMPDKEGLATIRDLREGFGDVKIIAISGGTPRIPMDFLPIAKKMGAAEVLDKPFDEETLLETVARVLGL